MNSYLAKQQCGFRKGYSTQCCLLVMLQTWKNVVDKGNASNITKGLHSTVFPTNC